MKQLAIYAAVAITSLQGATVVPQQDRQISDLDPSTLRQMLVTQPDYSATQKFLFSEGFGGFGGKSKIAKLGSRIREEMEDQIIIHERGKPSMRIIPKRRAYSEFTEIEPSQFAVEPAELAKREDVVFRFAGTEHLYGNKVFKVEATYTDHRLESIQVTLYIAPELKNLVIKEEVKLGDKVQMITVLEDVSLNVSEKMFEVPAGYKKIGDPFKRIK